MLKIRILAAGAAGALALTAASASPATADERGRDALIGAGVGAIAGAMLGNGDSAYIAGGALAGAALGYAVSDNDDDRRHYRNGRYYRDGRYWRDGNEWRRHQARYDRRDWRNDRRDPRRDWRHERRDRRW